MIQDQSALILAGTVSTGMQKGKGFIPKPGYTKQFVGKLGYKPFPGTFNVELDGDNSQDRQALQNIDPILIEEWDDGEQSFGAVLCYPTEIYVGGKSEEGHVIVPKQTGHDRDVIEVISPKKLRQELDLEEDDRVELHIPEP